MTTIRRKRDDDSTFHSNSQCSGGGGGMDASQASMVALDASTIATDSSIPRRRRKRRRTNNNNNNNLLDQLQHINISNGEVGVPEQIVPHSVAPDDNSQTLTSSEDEIDDDTDDEGSQTHTATAAATAVALLLSDAEHAQRSVMRELVFGRPPAPAPVNPVDRKLQTLVRQSLANVQQGLPLTETTTPTTVASTQDDMTIDPAYARGNNRDSFDGHLSRSLFPAAATAAAAPPPLRQRSNSLPEGLMEDVEAAAATMDLG